MVELMIVIAIIGILAAIAVPQFGKLIAKSNEGTTKGNLGALRSALSIYYADTEGQYPSEGSATFFIVGRHGHKRKVCLDCSTNLDALVDGGYLDDIPDANLPLTDNSPGHATDQLVDPI